VLTSLVSDCRLSSRILSSDLKKKEDKVAILNVEQCHWTWFFKRTIQGAAQQNVTQFVESGFFKLTDNRCPVMGKNTWAFNFGELIKQ
jgi:hypothetical protein